MKKLLGIVIIGLGLVVNVSGSQETSQNQKVTEKKVVLEVIAKTLYKYLDDKIYSIAFLETNSFILKKSTAKKNKFLKKTIKKALKSCNKKKSDLVESRCVISVIKYQEPNDPTKNQKLVVKTGIDTNKIKLSWNGLEGNTSAWISLLSSQNKKSKDEKKKAKNEKTKEHKAVEIEKKKAEEENKKLLEELEKLKKEKLESQKMAEIQKNKVEEEKLYNELNLLYGSKCKKSFFNNLYEVGTPEYKTCIFNKGPQKQNKAKQLAAQKKAEEKKKAEELHSQRLAKKEKKKEEDIEKYNRLPAKDRKACKNLFVSIPRVYQSYSRWDLKVTANNDLVLICIYSKGELGDKNIPGNIGHPNTAAIVLQHNKNNKNTWISSQFSGSDKYKGTCKRGNNFTPNVRSRDCFIN